jgi:hypothetical protein
MTKNQFEVAMQELEEARMDFYMTLWQADKIMGL